MTNLFPIRGRSNAQKKLPTKIRRESKQVSKKTHGFVPARFKLLPIESDVKLAGTAWEKDYIDPTTNISKKAPAVKKTRIFMDKVNMMTRTEQLELLHVKKKNASLEDFKLEDITFESFNLRPEIYEAIRKGPLKGADPFMPSEIQALAIPEILKVDNRHIMCAAETGSGKTLAYLIPIINKLKEEEARAGKISKESKEIEKLKEGIDKETPQVAEAFKEELKEKMQLMALKKSAVRSFNRPRAVVLLPSRELVDQILSVAKLMSHFAKFRAIAMTSHKDRTFVKKTLQMPVDIVIATPAGLLDYSRKKFVNLMDVKYLVIDEADTLFGKGFGEEVLEVIQKVKGFSHKKERPYQAIVVSATLPKTVNEMLTKEFPFIKRITSHSLHKALPNLHHHFVDTKEYNFNKSAAIIDILKRTHDENSSTMIFCNTRISAMALESFLKSKQYPVIGLFSDAEDRTVLLEKFRRRTSEANILVCTDLASRGVDTTFVNHVILYDFPTTVVDFLHRVGRTARAGNYGRATHFVTKKSRELAERIKRNIRDRRVLV
ncbi:6293_t:CDS:1 [Diversispora eburnea]|uniref:6293_t:CDS:1 n=1 Tax=Diversispora eburnea TaxID=1213867 RepID=A0A9N8V169_9GLOM|nr:6293_t:CDS:1 [Diversispora eburnea]